MKTMGAFEAKTHFSSILAKVEKGEQVIITKHGHPVAKLVPLAKSSQEEKREAVKALQAFGQVFTLRENWKELRDKGRKK